MEAEKSQQLQRTFVMLKPDALHRGLVGQIITRFERKGYKLVAAKLVKVTASHVSEHYRNRSQTPFFFQMCDYIAANPVFVMIWEGLGVVKGARMMLGDTNPEKALPGSIRGDFSLQYHNSGRNVIHASDDVSEARREIALWFSSQEIVEWTSACHTNLYDVTLVESNINGDHKLPTNQCEINDHNSPNKIRNKDIVTPEIGQ